jgi:hypothetical protein
VVVVELAILDLLALDVLGEPLDLPLHVAHIFLVEIAHIVQRRLDSHVVVHLADTVSIQLGQVARRL